MRQEVHVPYPVPWKSWEKDMNTYSQKAAVESTEYVNALDRGAKLQGIAGRY